MMKNNRCRGSVTIFISLILCACMLFVSISFEYFKAYAGDAMLKSSVQLAAYTATADFDDIVLDAYGLLKMSNSEEELNENLRQYINNSLQASNIGIEDTGEFLSDNLLNMQVDSLEVTGVKGSELYNPSVLEKQIVEYMKYRAPVELSQDILKKFEVFKSLGQIEDLVQKKNKYDTSLGDIQISFNKINKSVNNIKENFNKCHYKCFNDLLDDATKLDSKKNSLIKTDSYVLFVVENEYFNESNVIASQNMMTDYQIINYFDENLYRELDDMLELIKLQDFYDIKYKEELINTSYENYHKLGVLRDQLVDDLKCERQKGNTENTAIISDYESKINEIDNKIEKFKIIIDLNDKMRNLKDKAEGIFNVLLHEINRDYLRDYEYYNNISFELKSIKNELLILKNNILIDVKNNLQKYKESIDKVEDKEIKRSFDVNIKDDVKNINVDKIDEMISLVEKGIGICDNHIEQLSLIEYRGQHIAREELDISAISFHKDRISESAYVNDIEKNFLGDYSNIFLFNKLDCEKVNFDDIYQSDFYKFIENHTSKKKKKSDSASKQVEKINSIIHTSNYEKKDENYNYLPIDGPVYDDLASVLYDKAEQEQELQKEAISNIEYDDEAVENSKVISTSQMDFFDKSIGNTFGDYKFSTDNLEYIRNELYILSYINSNFTNQVSKDKKDDKEHFIDEEMEYLLFGKKGDKGLSNAHMTNTMIFGTRYVLNTVYAYTDSEIRTYTFSIASSLAGLTGFGVPIVQNVLILLISFAESIMDVNELLQGESVVIYKSYASWRLKPSNISKEIVKEASKDIANISVDKLFEKINDFYDDKSTAGIDSIVSEAEELSDVAIESMINSIVSSLMAPIEAKLVLIENRLSDIDLRSDYENMYENLATGNKIYDEVLRKTLDYLLASKIDEIESKLKNIDIINSDKVSDEIADMIKDERDKIITHIKTDYLDKYKYEIKNKLLAAEKKGKEAMNSEIEEYFDKLNYDCSKGQKGDLGDFSKSSLISMNYDEYINLYLIISLMTSRKEDILVRIGDIIKVNRNLYDSEEDFMFKDSYTLFKINANAKLNFRLIKDYKYFFQSGIDCEVVYGY